MSANSTQVNPAIAPPLLIVICILGAVMAVIVVAALYKMCRRANANTQADQETGNKAWNPNQRSIEQTRYMEEVRMRNRMFAWDRSRAERHERELFENPYNVRAKFVEEYLDDVSLHDNPYEGMVDKCIRRQSQHVFLQPPGRSHRPPHDDFEHVEPQMTFSERGSPQQANSNQFNNSGVRITVNDDGCDVADAGMGQNSKWPPRQSRMFRSSSIYSGDALLPSTHLHMVHSSSSYAFGRNAKLT